MKNLYEVKLILFDLEKVYQSILRLKNLNSKLVKLI